MKSLSMSVLGVVALTSTLPPFRSPIANLAFAQQVAGEKQATGADFDSLKTTALQEAESGETDNAIRDYQRVLNAQPEWNEGRWNLGMLEYESGRYDQAKAAFLKIVAVAPNAGIAWAVLGLSEFETKAYNDALAHLEKAQSLGMKDDAEIERVATYHLALLMIRGADFERAAHLLLKNFGGDLMSPQVKTALGLASLRVPLLPDEADPSQEALIASVGTAAAGAAEAVSRYAALLRAYPDIPYLHYAYGLALFENARNTEAIAAMREESGVSPNSPLPWIEISRIELGLGHIGDALAAAREAVTLGPNNRAAHEALAQSLNAAGERQAAVAERALAANLSPTPETRERRILLRYENADANVTTAPKLDAELWNKAMREYGSGQYAAAIPDLKACLLEIPGNGTGWAVLGLSEFALLDYDNALIHLNRGEGLGLSGNADSLRLARYTLGILLIQSGEFDRGSEALISASKLPPTNQVSTEKIEYALGLALLRRPELPGRATPQDAAVILEAGKIRELLHNSEYDAAFVHFQALLQPDRNFPFLHYAYGTALLAMSEFDEAAVQMKIETTISPASELPYVRLASIDLRKHDPDQASIAAKRAVKLAPNSAEAHYLLGRALLEGGDETAALPELLAAARISPGSPEVHFNLAKAYARAKMPEQAERERALFTQLNEAVDIQRKKEAGGSYQGPHDAGEMSVSSQVSPIGITTASPQ